VTAKLTFRCYSGPANEIAIEKPFKHQFVKKNPNRNSEYIELNYLARERVEFYVF